MKDWLGLFSHLFCVVAIFFFARYAAGEIVSLGNSGKFGDALLLSTLCLLGFQILPSRKSNNCCSCCKSTD